MAKGMHEKLESPLNTPQVQSDKDRQAKTALRKGGGGLLARQKRILAATQKAERDSYKLNKRDKF